VQRKLVIRKELVKIKGNYKVIIVKKEDFLKVLKVVKLRILHKEYEALMPPLDGMLKNNIDVNGLAVLLTQYMSIIVTDSSTAYQTTPAQMALYTQSGTVTLTYTGSVNINTQGVSVYLQIFENNGNYVYQYYYVGYDTTGASYTTSKVELYASAYVGGSIPNTQPPCCQAYYTDIVRIAYADVSFTKDSNSYLFIVWLIQFQNVPPYLTLFIPTLQNNANIQTVDLANGSKFTVYFNNNACNFTCGGGCPSASLTGFVTYVQGNVVVMEFSVMVALGGGVSTVEMLVCSTTNYINTDQSNVFPIFSISYSFKTTLSPPVGGAQFYLGLATITVAFQTA